MDSRKLLTTTEPLLIVAPMQGVTDYAFRCTMEAVGGMDAFVSEYIVVADDFSYSKREIKDVIKTYSSDDCQIPLIPQLIASSAKGAVKVIHDLQKHGIFSIDVNMGCPTKSAIHRQCGAWHSEHPKEALELLKILRAEVPKGLSVKTRIGMKTTQEFNSLLDILNESACDFVTLHCRLASEGYHGEVYPEMAKEASAKLRVPLLYNGGITDPSLADKICLQTGSKGVMIGKGIMQNPWLFKQIRQYRTTGTYSPPTKEEFVLFFLKLHRAYQQEPLSSDAFCLKRVKQLLAAFRHPNLEWKNYLLSVFRSDTESELFRHIESIPLILLDTIGKGTNTYFDEYLDLAPTATSP